MNFQGGESSIILDVPLATLSRDSRFCLHRAVQVIQLFPTFAVGQRCIVANGAPSVLLAAMSISVTIGPDFG